MPDAYVTIDAGTGGGKCVVFDSRGNVLGAHRESWTYDVHIDPEIPFVKEFSFDAPRFWGILCRCTRNALSQSGVQPKDVAGVAATSQREGCVFVDDQGREVYAGPNLDARAFREGLDILSEFGAERLYRITGHSAPFIFPLARYLWFRKHSSATVAHLLMINDWITWRLSGVATAEPSNATESMLFDLEGRCWSADILAAFDIPSAMLPTIRRCGDRIGEVTAEAAAATGLAQGTPVFVGGADTQCSLLGAGAIADGATAATLGTTTPIQMVVDRAVFDPHSTLWAGCHVVQDRWVLESNAGDTGDAYLWILDMVSGGAPREEALALGERLAAGSVGAPTLMFVGPNVFNLNKMALNRPGGILFPYPALHVRPSRENFVRSFMENVAFAIHGNLEQIRGVIGHEIRRLTLSGGMSRSRTLNRVIADVTGLEVHVARQAESAALGCAILIRAAEDRDFEAAVGTMVQHDTLEPDLESHTRHMSAYAKWREIDDKLGDIEI
ncbi:MAG TPA: FGGY family carbohydrate kinase [Candidatus Acidoferrales bacterium]|nr:FGGY family carbohydrate kinase [Candidatus Acidoferrales bacterium]